MTRLLVLTLFITTYLHGTQTLEINYNPIDISTCAPQEIFAYNLSRLAMYTVLNDIPCDISKPYSTTNHIVINVDIYTPQGELSQRDEDYIALGLFWESLDYGNKWGGHKRQANVHRFEAKL